MSDAAFTIAPVQPGADLDDARVLFRAYAASLPQGVVAMLGALSLFVLPIDWRAGALR